MVENVLNYFFSLNSSNGLPFREGCPVDNAELTPFVCIKCDMARETAGQAVGTELTPETVVSLMLWSEQIWTLIELFLTLVMKTRELDGRRERNSGKASRNRIGACTREV